jgi:hypothetical protein
VVSALAGEIARSDLAQDWDISEMRADEQRADHAERQRQSRREPYHRRQHEQRRGVNCEAIAAERGAIGAAHERWQRRADAEQRGDRERDTAGGAGHQLPANGERRNRERDAQPERRAGAHSEHVCERAAARARVACPVFFVV